MKLIKFVSVIIIIGLIHVANTTALDPTPIVDGIGSICPMGIGNNVAGIPGPMEIFSSSATGPLPIVSADEDASPSFAVVGVASTSGKGRIVGLGHDGFFINSAIDLYDNNDFGLNIINWLQNNQNNRKVIITSGHGEPWVGGYDYERFRNALVAQGYNVVITPGEITPDVLSGASIILISCPGLPLTNQEIVNIRSFVTNGGGLFMQGLGWSWVQYQHQSLEDYPLNKVADPYGFKWIGGYISDSEHNHYRAPIFSLFYPDQGKLLNVPYFYQGGTNWCWANSLAMILQYFGKGDHAWNLASLLKADRSDGLWDYDPLEMALIKSYFLSKNLVLNVYTSVYDKDNLFQLISYSIDKQKTPIGIAFDPSNFRRHWIVVVGYKIENGNKYIYYLDPEASFSGINPARARYEDTYDKFYNDHKKNIRLYYITGTLTPVASPKPPLAAMCIVDGENANIELNPNIVHKVINKETRQIDSYIILSNGINYRTRNIHLPGFSRIDELTNYHMLRFYNCQVGNWKDSNEFLINARSLYVSNPSQEKFNGVLRIIFKINNEILQVEDIDLEGIPGGFYRKLPNEDIILDLSSVTQPKDASIEFILLDYSNHQIDKIGPINFEIKFPNPDSWELEIDSPVNPIIVDPDGLTIAKQVNEIAGAEYVEIDADADGDTIGVISIPNRKLGIYQISVVPKENIEQEDNYTLTVYSNDQIINLAKNIKIKNIPNYPYSIETTDAVTTIPISIEENAFPLSAAHGALINFTINLTNTGTVPLSHIQVIDHLPDGLNYISDNQSGVLTDETVTWNDLPSLEIGESICIQLTAIIDPHASGDITNFVEAIGIRETEAQEEVSNSGISAVRVLEPGIRIDKTLGIPEPVQYGQFCENQKVTGTGIIDVSTTMVDKRLAVKYSNAIAGNGDIEIESENALAESASKLMRNIGNNSTPVNLYEDTKITYSGDTPLTGQKRLQSDSFYGGIGAEVQEAFSVNEMEKSQQAFFSSTDPSSGVSDQNETEQLRNESATHLVGMNSDNSFNGTWGTDSWLHKALYQDIRDLQSFTGNFEIQKLIKFHENPEPDEKNVRCEGIDC